MTTTMPRPNTGASISLVTTRPCRFKRPTLPVHAHKTRRSPMGQPPYRACLTTACLLIVCLPLVGLTATHAWGQQKPIALEGATVHTVSGAILDPGVVVIDPDTGRITAVGAAGTTTVPAGATRIDLSGTQITPGLVAIDTQLGLVEIDLEKSTRDADAGGKDPIRAAFLASDGFNPSSLTLPIARPGGITSALIVPTGGLISGQSAWIDLHDRGPNHARMVRDTIALHIHLGAQNGSPLGDSRGAAILRLRELFDDVSLYRDNNRSYTQRSLRELSASRLDLEALSQAQDAKRPTFWGADRASDIIAALNLSKAFGLTPIIAGGAEAWRVLKPLKDAGATVILNPLSNLPRSFDALGSRADTATLLHKASIPVVLAATYFNTHNARNLRQVAGNAVRAGLPRDAALRAITLAPATAVGMDKDYGSLDQGKVANLVVWSGDPFAFSSQVEQLYIGGRRVSLDNRQQQLFERYRTIPRRQNVVAPAP